ncbi:hypothetical protein [Alicyclobacillus acidiphilus]|uniref:hypothetical protein n=1 Tax=Alicyclobacillus acidiphilus TaxID=182455 RepID=UPI00082CF3DE|nr:hypothetical protein [Alicyclobacillus acidiphilus]
MNDPAWNSRNGASPGSNMFALAGSVIGIIGFVLSWIPIFGVPIGYTLGILAIIFSAIGLARANRLAAGHSAATAGLILGIMTVVLKSIPLINLL